MDIIHYKLIFKTIIFFSILFRKSIFKIQFIFVFQYLHKGQIVYKFLDFKTLKAPGPLRNSTYNIQTH